MLWNTNAKFQELYYKTLIAAYRTHQVQGSTDIGRITLELDKVYILPYLVVKNPAEVSHTLISKNQSESSLSIWDFLGKIEQEPAYRRILILAAPGRGKTLLLEYLTLIYAQGNHREEYEKAPKLIPVLLSLRQIRKLVIHNPDLTLAQIITTVIKRLSTLKLDPSIEWFEQKLTQGKCLIMLDGLDEIVNINERRIVGKWLDEQMGLYPESSYIITSRPYGYLNYPLKTITICLELPGYNSQQIKQFLDNFYLEQELFKQAHQEDRLVQQRAQTKAFIINRIINIYPPFRFMAANPLLLTFMAFFCQNPNLMIEKRLELCKEICKLLLINRPNAKGIATPYNLDSSQSQLILQKLALGLMCNQQTQFTLEEGVKIISEPFSAMVEAKEAPIYFLQYIESVTGLLQQVSAQVYQFIHFSFQEYLAATEIKQTNQEQILITKIDQPWWSETIRLYGACSNTSKLILAALDQRSLVTLNLAYDCWEEGQAFNPDLKKRLENWLDAALESSDPQIARLAARVHLSRRLKYALALD
jgi:predicted NACHT family NTPase